MAFCLSFTLNAATLNVNKVYKKDVWINGQIGMAVFPYAKSYELHIKAVGKLDWFQYTSCHRDIGSEDASNVTKTIFKIKQKNEVRVTYTPTRAEQGFCPLRIAANEHKKGRHSFGFIDFEDPSHTISALVHCNGTIKRFNGVSVCESKVGLIQMIEFEDDVAMSGCGSKPSVAKVFKIKVVKDIAEYCVYSFMDMNKNKHRLTIGTYDEIALRE